MCRPYQGIVVLMPCCLLLWAYCLWAMTLLEAKARSRVASACSRTTMSESSFPAASVGDKAQGGIIARAI